MVLELVAQSDSELWLLDLLSSEEAQGLVWPCLTLYQLVSFSGAIWSADDKVWPVSREMYRVPSPLSCLTTDSLATDLPRTGNTFQSSKLEISSNFAILKGNYIFIKEEKMFSRRWLDNPRFDTKNIVVFIYYLYSPLWISFCYVSKWLAKYFSWYLYF